MLIRKAPGLQVIDGREVSMEERDYVENYFAASASDAGMVASAGGSAGGNSGSGASTAGGFGISGAQLVKVPLRMTAMNFGA